ncbi:metallophosphoesterase [Bradyrhizobium sp. LTSPM299]|uniref:metallophosphoesterase family protein n=1 Tax=Bradyrhizobium sp. LTSPM299 TaxID=1619233 RepID=UPI0009E5D9E4|nr:metallophosphoesterase [Bradyrhizobium sp. LTSPM299]
MGKKAIARARKTPVRKTRIAPSQAPSTRPLAPPIGGEPEFAQPEPTSAPGKFRTPHKSDAEAYSILDELKKNHEIKPSAFPRARGGDEPVLTLEQIWGSEGKSLARRVIQSRQIIFHSVGDTGNTRSVKPQEAVADKMEADFLEEQVGDKPIFFLHLGDVVYSFGEKEYYYDQFYEPYRNYPAPIIAIAGNHDGMVAPNTNAITLDAFLSNFCTPGFKNALEAGGLDRTTMIQPGVYYTFEAPYVRILCLYSNTLEDPGIISTEEGHFPQVTDVQLTYLRAALTRIKSENFKGAVIVAIHHPIFTHGSGHGGSPNVMKQMDKICQDVGIWPHAVLSGHAHNYQRFTRRMADREIPYIIGGNGGHATSRLRRKQDGGVLRVPTELPQLAQGRDTVVFENYDDQNYGYLRVFVDEQQLRVEYHPASDGRHVKAPDDHVTVDLSSHKLVAFDTPHARRSRS